MRQPVPDRRRRGRRRPLVGSRWQPLDLDHGKLDSVNSIVQGRRPPPRTTWIGTYGNGVLRWSAGRALRFGPERGLASRLVTSLALRDRGAGEQELWAGTRDRGLFRLANERFVSAPLGAAIPEIYSLKAGGTDDPGALWVGTRAAGLLRFEPGSWAALDRSSGLPADQVLGFLETVGRDGEPIQWIGTANGLAVIRGGRPEGGGRGARAARATGARAGRAARGRPGARDLGFGSSVTAWSAAWASVGFGRWPAPRSTRITAPGCSRAAPRAAAPCCGWPRSAAVSRAWSADAGRCSP